MANIRFRFEPLELPASAQETRKRIRAFLEGERAAGRFEPQRSSWATFDAEFSRRAGQAGFIGMIWPTEYGGAGATDLDRFVVMEEMLAASAPCYAHWVADRQTGMQILRFGSERLKQTYLPRMARGECFSAIGMSEPDAGSDLASVRTRGTKVDGGWRINGSKIWTSNAHRSHVMTVLARTEPLGENRHAGLTQFLVDTSTEGLTRRPIINMTGEHDFNEVHFDNCFVPDDMVLGQPGQGWQMVNAELSNERAGPDRFLSDYWLLVELIKRIGATPDRLQSVEIGRLVAHLSTLRRMSSSVAGLLASGTDPQTEAAIVKDVGTAYEQALPEIARRLTDAMPSGAAADPYELSYAYTRLFAPGYTIRGGAREIMRGIIARALGVR